MSELQLVRGAHDSWRDRPSGVGVPNLLAAPCRPGELPTIMIIELSKPARKALAERVHAIALPAELWLRIAVEAERHLRRTTDVSGVPRQQLVAHIDERASSRVEYPTPIHGHRHRLYAREVRKASTRRGPTIAVDRELTMRISEEQLAAWSNDAASAGRGFHEWVSDHLVRSPQSSWEWEATAAEAGQSIGELIYSVALGRSTAR